MELLTVDSVSVAYGNIRALWGVSLRVGKGEIVAAVGANGAGKSTLLRSVMGLVGASGGSIRLRGVEIIGERPHEIVSKGVSFVPEGRRLFPLMTVKENLCVGAPRRCVDLEERIAKVYFLFPQLEDSGARLAGSLSGGEQQMVAIGRAMMAAPELMLVDEPTLGLAPGLCAKVLGALEDLARQGTAVLLAEQNLEVALEACSRAYLFENGRIVASDRSQELRAHPALREAYLGVAVQ